jgi:hypothetical protein
MSRTVIFKIYLFDGHIYVDMTKNELKRLIVEVYSEMNEGAIDSKEVADKIFDGIKSIIKVYSKEYKGEPISDEQLMVIVKDINDDIQSKLVDTGISPCPIKFDKLERCIGKYDIDTKDIHLSLNYLIKVDSGIINFLDMRRMELNDMRNTIEHELIHQKQDEKSKGKLFSNKIFNYIDRKYINKNGNSSIDDILFAFDKDSRLYDIYRKLLAKILKKDYSEIIDRKKFIDPYVSDDKFIENMMYYNKRSELNTFAKEAVNMYIKNTLTNLKTDITYQYRRSDVVKKKEFTSAEVRALILPFVDFDTTKYNSDDMNFLNRTRVGNYNFKKKILSYYDEGYDYLTKENKKKWWRYVFHLLLNYKFEPIILKK